MSRLSLTLWLLLALSCPVHSAEDLKIDFDERGLASITHNGVELVKPRDNRFQLRAISLADAQAKDGARQFFEPKPVAQHFDPEKKLLVQEYDPCQVECAFIVGSNRLEMQITLLNKAAHPISQCEFSPLTVHLPHTARNAFKWERRQAFLVDRYEHEKGTVIVTPRGYFAEGPREGLLDSRPLSVFGPAPEKSPHHPIVDDSWFYDPGTMVLPGKSASYRVSLVFGPLGATALKLCPEAYDEYATAHPMQLQWPDRRPIATAFLCNPSTGWKTNPRGYFQDSKVDVVSENGLKAFGERLMRYADTCIARMQKMDAQGIIVWDIEGQEVPHMISYVGDPRQIAKLSPEMDRYADAFMKKFRDAGFKTGVTIRPTEIYQPNQPGQLPWNQREVKDPVATMSEKMTYAQKRWGCTIFYLDSNVFGDGLLTPGQKKEMRNIPWTMPMSMLKKLVKLHPDCLICPEWATREYYRIAAPYSSPNLNDGGTDPLIRRLWPNAFRLVAVRQGLLEKRWEHFAESVEQGDVLLFLPWFDASENVFLQLLYREAAIRKSGASTALATADFSSLVEKSNASAEPTRYAAATALGRVGTPDAVSALAKLLKDESPLVRKQALAGLAQAKKIDDRSCIAMLTEWIQGSKDPIQNALRSQAAEALSRAGDAAVPALLGLLANPKAAGTWPYAVRALGRTATGDVRVGQALLDCLNDKTSGKAQLRNDIIEALGLLKVKDAVPALLPILDKRNRESEDERGAVVVALGRIGDRRAIDPLLKQLDVTYSTVVVYWIGDALENALRGITGEQHIVGKNEWQRWNKNRKT